MKNINKVIISLLSLFLMFSCYEDKGNYDYKDLNEIEISGLKLSYNLNVGDTLKLDPKLSFSLDSSASYTCEWKLNMDKVLSSNKELFYIIPGSSSSSENLLFTITDDDTGYTTQYEMNLSISQLFANGWVVLSEKDGRSSLDFIKEVWVEDDEGNDKMVFKEYFDTYKTFENEDLGSQPMYIRPHWREYTTDGEIGHVLVVQKGGQACVDLFGENLTKSLETVKEFTQIPDDFDPKDVLYADKFSYILNSDGKIFSRKNYSKVAFYSGYFSNYPMGFEYNGEFTELNVDRFVHGVDYQGSKLVLVYEKENKRFLALSENISFWGPDKSGEVLTIESDDYSGDFIPLHNTGDNELFFSHGYGVSAYGGQGLYNIFKTSEGKYVEQQFTLRYDVYGSLTVVIDSKKQRNFPDGYLDENSIVDVPDGGKGRGTTNVFISKGNTIYFYSRLTDGEISLTEYYTFDSDIVAMEDQHWQNKILCVGLANGEVYFMDITTEALANKKEKLMHKVSKASGNIKQILQKSPTYQM